MIIRIPKFCLILLIGPSGSGKTTFARKHFLRTQVLSSDHFRAMVSDSARNQAVTKDAFEALHFVAAKRLANGRLTVIDATNIHPDARNPLIRMGREHDCATVGIVFNLSQRICLARNRERRGRRVETQVLRRQWERLQASLAGLKEEGFDYVYVFHSARDVDESAFKFLAARASGNSEGRGRRIPRLNGNGSSDKLSGEI